MGTENPVPAISLTFSGYVGYYHDDRTHLGLGKDTPTVRPVTSRPSSAASITATSGATPPDSGLPTTSGSSRQLGGDASCAARSRKLCHIAVFMPTLSTSLCRQVALHRSNRWRRGPCATPTNNGEGQDASLASLPNRA